MATLTADRHLAQHSLFDPHEEELPPRPPQPPATPAVRAPREDAAATPGPTLDDLVAGTWDALAITHAAACLMCGEDLTPRFASGPHPVAAMCRSCGTELR